MPPTVEIRTESEKYAYRDLFRVVEAELRHRRFDGALSTPMVRVNFARGPAAAVLLFDPERRTVILTRQFRYPAHVARGSEEAAAGWLLEIPAGIHEDDGALEGTARRELLEEVGVRVHGELERLVSFFPSPGASSELVTLFLARVSRRDRVAGGGGVAGEGEDIQVLEMPVAVAFQLLREGVLRDAKTIIALQYLALELAGVEMGPPR